MNTRNGSKNRSSKMVPVSINGTTIKIDANSIAKSERIMHHGKTANGTQVNSAQSCTIGDSTIVWPSDGAPAVSFLNTDLEVFATQFLQSAGFSVKASA